jgi:hypothetical protein
MVLAVFIQLGEHFTEGVAWHIGLHGLCEFQNLIRPNPSYSAI